MIQSVCVYVKFKLKITHFIKKCQMLYNQQSKCPNIPQQYHDVVYSNISSLRNRKTVHAR